MSVTDTVDVNADVLVWARIRSERPYSDLVATFPRLPHWESGEIAPTFKQLENFATATYVPVGWLLLDEPPEEADPLPDFRTMHDKRPNRIGVNLRDTIRLCRQRQSWYREYLIANGEPPVAGVGSLDTSMSPQAAATEIRTWTGLKVADRSKIATWHESLKFCIEQIETSEILVMRSGIVGGNTHRPLDYREFRGFAIVDAHAPLIFLNSTDSVAGQIFTLAHELAHIAVGESGVSSPDLETFDEIGLEKWCNEVATEILVPGAELHQVYSSGTSPVAEANRLAKYFKVSSLVILRCMKDERLISDDIFFASLQTLKAGIPERSTSESGGEYYNSTLARVSPTFARALIRSTLEGQTLYRDALRLVGAARVSTLEELGRRVGVG